MRLRAHPTCGSLRRFSDKNPIAMRPRLIDTIFTPLSRYVTLVDRKVDFGGAVESFHGMKVGDYVNVLPVDLAGRVTLVEQYRPILDRNTIEFPGGHRDANEEPVATAARELREETGLIAGEIVAVCELFPDPGRLTNRFWGFVARGCAADPNWTPESETRAFSVDASELHDFVATGRLDNAPHVALHALAVVRGLLPSADRAGRTE
ncbi:MAG: NUDIX hydrolase [Tagaea sp.]